MIVEWHGRQNTPNVGLQLRTKLSLKHLEWHGRPISFRLYVIIMSRTSFRVNPHSISLHECQGTPCSKQAPYLKFKWQQRDLNRLDSLAKWLSVCLQT